MNSDTQASDLSRAYTAIVLGADLAYREAGPGSGDQTLEAEGLIPVHWADLDVKPLSLPEAQQKLLNCAQDASQLHHPHLRDWLTEQALATRNLLHWVGGGNVSYEDVVAGCVRVPPQAPSASHIAQHQAELNRALRAAGLPEGRAGLTAYREQDAVPTSALQNELQVLLDEGRERTQRYLPQLQVHTDPIQAHVLHGVPFSAYCDYPGRRVWLNGDLPYTRSGLKHLVGHEAYPGHDVHMTHREFLTRSGAMPLDGALVITNTASSVLFEGIAEIGLDLLHWRDTPFDHIEWHYTRLKQLCSIEAAHALNTNRSTPVEVARFLKEQLNADDAWIEARLRFFTHRLRAPFIYTYWWGNELTSRFWQSVPVTHAHQAVSHLYDHMHSPSTLFAHWSTRGTS